MNEMLLHTYAVKHNDEIVRSASRSGGIFTAISDIILAVNGCVYGCVLTDDFKAIHIRATTEEERNCMRGSKYIQSTMGDVYKQVKIDLENAKEVLFSGTSCQIAGLKAFLGKEYDRLLCVDIVCHGVPSPLIWEKYIQWQEAELGKKCIKVDFRNKKQFGWASHMETLTMEDGTEIHSNVFTTLFYEHSIIRPACSKCPYKSIIHPADITIADYWGIDKAAPGFNDNKGVSLVLINNEKGNFYFEKIKENINFIETCIEDSMQEPLIAPFAAPVDRRLVWNDLLKKPFSYSVEKYTKISLIKRIKRKLRKVLYGLAYR